MTATVAAGECASRAARLVASDRVLVIAHRGHSGAAPENTLPAFRAALDLGVDMVELDYHHTADGVPLVVHDATPDRTTDAAARWGEVKAAVASKPLAEFAALDAGSWFDPRYAAARLPTLRDALAAIVPGAVAMIERKAGDPATLVRLLEEGGWMGDVVVQSFDWEFLAQCKRLAPRIVTGALGRRDISAAKLDTICAAGASFLGWSNPDLTPQGIAKAHERGLRAYVFTVDDAPRAAELVRWGIDGIISNAPTKLELKS